MQLFRAAREQTKLYCRRQCLTVLTTRNFPICEIGFLRQLWFKHCRIDVHHVVTLRHRATLLYRLRANMRGQNLLVGSKVDEKRPDGLMLPHRLHRSIFQTTNSPF